MSFNQTKVKMNMTMTLKVMYSHFSNALSQFFFLVLFLLFYPNGFTLDCPFSIFYSILCGVWLPLIFDIYDFNITTLLRFSFIYLFLLLLLLSFGALLIAHASYYKYALSHSVYHLYIYICRNLNYMYVHYVYIYTVHTELCHFSVIPIANL